MKIVFVHLGKYLPNHLISNIKHVTNTFKKEVVLITDLQCKYKTDFSNSVKTFIYDRDESFATLSKSLNHDRTFRDGFWFSSLERFFAIHNFHSFFPNESIMHIESDVLLLKDFPWQHITTRKGLMWENQNQHRDVSAIFYSENFSFTNWLIDKFPEEISLNPKATDMSILRNIYHKYHNAIALSYFPTISSSLPISEFFSQDLFNELKFQEFANFQEFNGIFDAAGVGMWLTGQDPRNNYGFTKYFDNSLLKAGDCAIDLEKVLFTTNDGTLKISYGNFNIPIWNLHIHSKNLKYFESGWERYLEKVVSKSNHAKNLLIIFSLSTFGKLLINNWNQRSLRSYLRHLIKFSINLLKSLSRR